MTTQPFFYMCFPPKTIARRMKVGDLLLHGIHVVRAIIVKLTEFEWGTPLELPTTPPHFVTPLTMTISD